MHALLAHAVLLHLGDGNEDGEDGEMGGEAVHLRPDQNPVGFHSGNLCFRHSH